MLDGVVRRGLGWTRVSPWSRFAGRLNVGHELQLLLRRAERIVGGLFYAAPAL